MGAEHEAGGAPPDEGASSADVTRWIRSNRPEALLAAREALDPWGPFAWEVEEELSRTGSVDATGTVFITNRECPFTCLMCDLWRYTTRESVPVGAVDAQVAEALAHMPEARHLKLYNAGNFFDDRAISPEDRARIAVRMKRFDTVIVENHPKLTDDRVAAWRDSTGTDLDVAMGLETIHPAILPRLNKAMALDDFEAAVGRLRAVDVRTRAFVLVRAPYMTEAEGVEWACRSVEWAFEVGVECCSVIPVRAGNGALDALAVAGDFAPPALRSLEAVAEYGIGLGRGRVFVDLWDVERIATCPECADTRVSRLREMNLTQRAPVPVRCACAT